MRLNHACMYNQSRKSGHPHLKPVVGILSVGVLSGHVEPIHLRGHVLDLVVTVHHAQSCCQLQHSRSPQHHFPSVVCWPSVCSEQLCDVHRLGQAGLEPNIFLHLVTDG